MSRDSESSLEQEKITRESASPLLASRDIWSKLEYTAKDQRKVELLDSFNNRNDLRDTGIEGKKVTVGT